MPYVTIAPPPPDPPGGRSLPGGRSQIAKVVAVIAILVGLLLPQLMISDLINERESRRDTVQSEIGRAWAGPQTLIGPVLVLPWRAQVQQDPNGAAVYQRGSLTILPATLRAHADLMPETRRRGLFEATVYVASASLAGSFVLPDISVPGMSEAELLWQDAYLLAGSNELRPAGMTPAMSFDGRTIPPGEIEPDTDFCGPPDSLRWPLGLGGTPEQGRAIPFEVLMELRGSRSFRIAPVARRSTVTMASTWQSPSFSGAELPARSSIDDVGFEAEWNSGTQTALVHRNAGGCRSDVGLARRAVGVELMEAVPTYRMVSRASKYTLLFLVLTFVTCAIFELTAKVKLHAVQYGLLGVSVVLFPLLLLAFGEPLGFTTAYAIAAAMVVGQASIYTWVVTRLSLGLVLAGVLTALFTFLHVVLRLDAYALLVGTLALFVALSIVMAVTRKVRWTA